MKKNATRIQITDTATGSHIGYCTPKELRGWLCVSKQWFIADLIKAYNAADHGQTLEQVLEV